MSRVPICHQPSVWKDMPHTNSCDFCDGRGKLPLWGVCSTCSGKGVIWDGTLPEKMPYKVSEKGEFSTLDGFTPEYTPGDGGNEHFALANIRAFLTQKVG